MLFKDYGSEVDPGEWFPFRFDESERERGRAFMELVRKGECAWNPDEFPASTFVRVRALRRSEMTEISRIGRRGNEALKLNYRKGRAAQAEVATDPAVTQERNLAAATKALTGLATTIGIETEAAAAKWSKLLGAPVAVGPLRLNGPINEGTKAVVFEIQPRLIDHVNELGDALAGRAVEIEEAEQGN